MDKVAKLRAAEPDLHSTITDKVIQAYRNKVLEQVDDILNRDTGEVRLTGLEAFLADNWRRVNGRQLSYTALPDSDVTKLLCDIAYYVQANKPRRLKDETKGVINYLMPTVNVYSDQPELYPDLLPSEANGHQDVDLDKILHTHVLGDKGLYLIPVEYLQQISEEAGTADFRNVYYDLDEHEESNAFLNEDESRRLRYHSDLTEQLFLSKDQYELLTSQSNSLYGHLRQLCNQLYFNSVDGVGQEKYAGNAAYLAIPQFFEYYDKLGSTELAKVPRAVKRALDTIKHYISDKETLGSIGSCLATRRKDLEKTMKGKEETLQAIAISGETQESLLQKASEQLNETKAELIERCGVNKYKEGKDKLGITVKLIRELNVNVAFNQLSDVDNLKTLTPDAILDFCRSSEYQSQIANAIGNLENMVILATELSPAQLTALVNGLDDALYTKIITSVKDFKPLTIVFDQERREIFWTAYHAKLKEKITTGEDFRSVGEVLSDAHKNEWYDAFTEDELMGLLKEPSDLFHIVVSMTAEQRKAFYDAFLVRYEQPEFQYKDKITGFFDKAFYLETHNKIKNKLGKLPADPDAAYIFLWGLYTGQCLNRIRIIALNYYILRPFDSVTDPIFTALIPFAPAILTLSIASWMVYQIMKTAWDLVCLQFSKLKGDLMFTALATTATLLAALTTSVVTLFSALSIACRTVSTVINPVTSRLSSCRFFKSKKESIPNSHREEVPDARAVSDVRSERDDTAADTPDLLPNPGASITA